GHQATEPAPARYVAARPVEARDVAHLDRVPGSREHDRNVFGRRHGGHYRSATSRRGDHVDLAADQISRQGRQAIEPVLRKTVLDGYVAAIDIAGFAQAAAEGGRGSGAIGLPWGREDSRHPRRPVRWL